MDSESVRRQVLDSVVLHDPKRVADQTLAVVMDLAKASAGGLLGLTSGKTPQLTCARGCGEAAAELARASWAKNRDVLRSGSPVRHGPDAIIPVLEDENVVALVYLEAHRVEIRELSEIVAPVAHVLARAVTLIQQRPLHATAWEDYLDRTSIDEIEREKLIMLLTRNEWNVSRVARVLGVTRGTIYTKMKKHKIPRERVIKTPRRTRPAES